MALDEAQIIRDCQAGRRDRFGLLYDAYVRRIHDFIYYKTHHRQTAEDLTSATFLKALERIDSYDARRGSFSAWLYRIARNSVIDHYRARKPAVNIQDVWDLSSDTDIPRDVDTRQQLERVQQFLATLPANEREIVLLRVWGGLSYREIADVSGRSEAACKMSFSRTIGKLREAMPIAVLVLIQLLSVAQPHTNAVIASLPAGEAGAARGNPPDDEILRAALRKTEAVRLLRRQSSSQ